MKKVFHLLICLIGLSNYTFSQIQIFGVTRNSTTQAIQLSTINPFTGSVTNVSANIFSSTYVGNGGTTIDPISKKYYIQSSGKIWEIDLATGNTISSPTVTTPFPGYFDMMVFNCTDSTIYGLMRNSSTQGIQLSKNNPTTGSVTNISGNVFSTTYVWNGWSTINRLNKIYYVQSNNKLWGISLVTGNTISSPTIVTPFPAYFDMMIYNNNDATLYGLIRNSTNQNLQLAKANPITGSVTPISTNTFSATYVLNAGATIDPVNKIYYIQSGNKLWGIDLITGNPISSTLVITPFPAYFDMMQVNINNCDGNFTTQISNFSKQINNFELYPNPNNGTFKLQIDGEINNGEIILINSLGQKVHEQKIIQGSNEIKTNGLATGLYNYILLEDKQKISNGKIILE